MSESYANEFSQKLKNKPQYMENYLENHIVPNVKKISKEIDIKIQSISFYFNPKLNGRTSDVWYASSKGYEKFERQEQTELKYYDPNAKDMAWFYELSKEKNKRWSKPCLLELMVKYIGKSRVVLRNFA